MIQLGNNTAKTIAIVQIYGSSVVVLKNIYSKKDDNARSLMCLIVLLLLSDRKYQLMELGCCTFSFLTFVFEFFHSWNRTTSRHLGFLWGGNQLLIEQVSSHFCHFWSWNSPSECETTISTKTWGYLETFGCKSKWKDEPCVASFLSSAPVFATAEESFDLAF